MKLRTGHVELSEDQVPARLFFTAAGHKCAWVTGKGGDRQELEELATKAGYELGELEDDSAWVAVRTNAVSDGVSSNGNTVEFQNKHLGQVVVDAETGEHETEATLEEWHTDSNYDGDFVVTTYRVEPA
jgi:hypothetical protein